MYVSNVTFLLLCYILLFYYIYIYIYIYVYMYNDNIKPNVLYW